MNSFLSVSSADGKHHRKPFIVLAAQFLRAPVTVTFDLSARVLADSKRAAMSTVYAYATAPCRSKMA